jgi:hypothetical protein
MSCGIGLLWNRYTAHLHYDVKNLAKSLYIKLKFMHAVVKDRGMGST